eukprot:2066506-Rhodomonas_salina.1
MCPAKEGGTAGPLCTPAVDDTVLTPDRALSSQPLRELKLSKPRAHCVSRTILLRPPLSCPATLLCTESNEALYTSRCLPEVLPESGFA